MQQLFRASLLFLGAMVAFSFIGCDAANDSVEKAKGAGTNMVDGAKDLAKVNFGDFDFEGMKEKFAGITDGFKSVTTDNVDGLKTKLSDLGGSVENMGIGNLKGPAKTAVTVAIKKFAEVIKTAMDGITDDSILAKLKPAVESLMEKLDTFI